jgi:hypothetical protein
MMWKSLAIVLLIGCNNAPAPDDGRDDSFLSSGKADTGGIVDGTPEALGVLRVANELSTDDLIHQAGLGVRAAENIGAYKLGDDGLAGTADDTSFENLAELDAVPYVGPKAFAALLAYARANGFVDTSPHVPACAELDPGTFKADLSYALGTSGSVDPTANGIQMHGSSNGYACNEVTVFCSQVVDGSLSCPRYDYQNVPADTTHGATCERYGVTANFVGPVDADGCFTLQGTFEYDCSGRPVTCTQIPLTLRGRMP